MWLNVRKSLALVHDFLKCRHNSVGPECKPVKLEVIGSNPIGGDTHQFQSLCYYLTERQMDLLPPECSGI